MSLNLLPEDAKAYSEAYAEAAQLRDAAVARGDWREATRQRQVISTLYHKYYQLRILEPKPLTLEQRVERIEKHLNIQEFE